MALRNWAGDNSANGLIPFVSSILVACFLGSAAWGVTTGSISGTISDASGAVIQGAAIIAVNTAQGLQIKTTTGQQRLLQLSTPGGGDV
jgi:hypothetical protein